MLAFPSEEEHFGLRRRTTQNKLFVPNYEAKRLKTTVSQVKSNEPVHRSLAAV